MKLLGSVRWLSKHSEKRVVEIISKQFAVIEKNRIMYVYNKRY